MIPSARSALIALVAALVLGVSGFWGGWKMSADHQIAAVAHDEHIQQVTYDAAQKAAADAISALRPINQQNKTVIERETRLVPDYSACRNSAGGLSVINAALEGRGAESAGSSVLP